MRSRPCSLELQLGEESHLSGIQLVGELLLILQAVLVREAAPGADPGRPFPRSLGSA